MDKYAELIDGLLPDGVEWEAEFIPRRMWYDSEKDLYGFVDMWMFTFKIGDLECPVYVDNERISRDILVRACHAAWGALSGAEE
jgi:hypothetical protein